MLATIVSHYSVAITQRSSRFYLRWNFVFSEEYHCKMLISRGEVPWKSCLMSDLPRSNSPRQSLPALRNVSLVSYSQTLSALLFSRVRLLLLFKSFLTIPSGYLLPKTPRPLWSELHRQALRPPESYPRSSLSLSLISTANLSWNVTTFSEMIHMFYIEQLKCGSHDCVTVWLNFKFYLIFVYLNLHFK